MRTSRANVSKAGRPKGVATNESKRRKSQKERALASVGEPPPILQKVSEIDRTAFMTALASYKCPSGTPVAQRAIEVIADAIDVGSPFMSRWFVETVYGASARSSGQEAPTNNVQVIVMMPENGR